MRVEYLNFTQNKNLCLKQFLYTKIVMRQERKKLQYIQSLTYKQILSRSHSAIFADDFQQTKMLVYFRQFASNL